VNTVVQLALAIVQTVPYKQGCKRIFDYSNIRIPNTIRIVNLIFEYSFVLIKAAYRD